MWGFHGGATSWRPPVASSLLKNLKQMNCFYLHPKCGKSKDAADFALCVQVLYACLYVLSMNTAKCMHGYNPNKASYSFIPLLPPPSFPPSRLPLLPSFNSYMHLFHRQESWMFCCQKTSYSQSSQVIKGLMSYKTSCLYPREKCISLTHTIKLLKLYLLFLIVLLTDDNHTIYLPHPCSAVDYFLSPPHPCSLWGVSRLFGE